MAPAGPTLNRVPDSQDLSMGAWVQDKPRGDYTEPHEDASALVKYEPTAAEKDPWTVTMYGGDSDGPQTKLIIEPQQTP